MMQEDIKYPTRVWASSKSLQILPARGLVLNFSAPDHTAGSKYDRSLLQAPSELFKCWAREETEAAMFYEGTPRPSISGANEVDRAQWSVRAVIVQSTGDDR